MATLDQIAQRRKELLAAEIAARREQAKQEALALLDKFDPSGGRATKSFMPPDPTWQGTGRQEVPGQDPTILDKRPDIWDKVPDMRTQEFDDTMMLPIPKAQPFNPADMVPMQRPSLDQADYSADVAGTSDWLRNVNFDLKRERRDRELGDYRRKQRLLREGAPLTSDAGTRTPTTEQIAALQDQDGLLTKRDQVADSASTLLDRRIPTDSAGTTAPTALIPRAEPTQQQPTPTRPYWDSIESIYGPNVRARVGDARADEMEMDRFGPAVTPGVVTRAPTTQRKTSSEAVDVLSQINRKKNILRAISSIWGTKDNSQSYETSALTKYGQQLTNRGLAQLTDADFENTRTFLQAGSAAGIPLKQLIEMIKGGVVSEGAAAPNRFKRNWTDIKTSKTWEITEQWDTRKGEMVEVSRAEKSTKPLVTFMGEPETDKESGKAFAVAYSTLRDDKGNKYRNLEEENSRIDSLVGALDGGMPTGFGSKAMMELQRFMLKILPYNLAENSETFKALGDKVGTQEWWKAASERFIGGMLAMTKGAVSDREMAIFMGMIPALGTTAAGNRRLLTMMKEMNEIALSDRYAALDLRDYLIEADTTVGKMGTPAASKKLDEFKAIRRKEASARFNDAAEPQTLEEAAISIRAHNPGMSEARALEIAKEYWSQ